MSSIPMCYTKCHNVHNFPLHKVTHLTNNMVLVNVALWDP